MKNFTIYLLPAVLISAMMIWSCAEYDRPMSNTDIAATQFKFAFPTTESTLSIDRVTVTVSGPGMGNIAQDLTISGNQASGTIEVPPGTDRIFRAEAYIGTVIYFSGVSEPKEVSAGQDFSVEITVNDLTPELEILNPATGIATADQSYVITWIDSDFDDNAQVALFYGPDTIFANSNPIADAQSISEDDPGNAFVWNTSALDSGDVYYIFGRITDNLHPSEYSHSGGKVMITHTPAPNTAPTIQLIQPDGVSDECDQSFLITWIDSDPDNNAIISLFYDSFIDTSSRYSIPGASNISENDPINSFSWDTSLLPDSSIYYVLAEICDSVNPIVYAISTGMVIIDHNLSNVPPPAPSNLNAVTISDSQIDLIWSDNSPNEQGFTIERHAEGGSFQFHAQTSANEASYSDTGLPSSATFYYRVRAFNGAGESSYSNTASASTLQPLPQAPSGLTVNALSTGSLGLDWDDNSSNELGFIVERRSGEAGLFSKIDTTDADISAFTDSGLQAGSVYQYRIAAYNAGGASTYSNIAGGQTLEEIPVAPNNLSAVAQSAFSVSLNWTDNSLNETGFKIERALSFAGPYNLIHTTSQNIQYYLDTNVIPSTIYFYRICAYNTAGLSAYSSVDSAETFNYDPAAPVNLNVTGSSSSYVSIAWDDMSTNENGFIIERAVGAGSFAVLHTTSANVEQYTDTQCSQLTQYSYRVKAFNSYAESDYSNVVQITTPEYFPFEMISVPAGIFTMGNEPYGYGNEYHPGNPVDLPAFSIMKYPVTNEEYAVFLDEMYDGGQLAIFEGNVYNADTTLVYMDLNHSECQIQLTGGNFTAKSGKQNYPVMLVSWYGADAFAEYNGMMLPTEAMWEKAARGTEGDDTNGDGVGDGYKYPWGLIIDGSYCNYQTSGDPWEIAVWPQTSPVGAYDGANYSGFVTHDNSSVYGVYDLCGNIYEWCQDWYGPYQNPHNPPSSGIYKTCRGGSWSSTTYYCRNAFRSKYTPDSRFDNIGFRCAEAD